jgi:hypothetical protein
VAPDQRLNSTLTFEREFHRNRASTLMFARPATIKIDNKPITIDCALSKLIVKRRQSRPGGHEVSLSRNLILIKLFNDLNPGSGLNV